MGDDEHVPVAGVRLADDGLVHLFADLGNQPVQPPGDLVRAPDTPFVSACHLASYTKLQGGTRGGNTNSLASRAAIAPDVPGAREPLRRAPPPDLGARDALVVAVVPLADVLGDLDARGALEPVARRAAVPRPGEMPRDAEVEQLKRPLGALPRGDVAAPLG